ncbi:hypothetical protein L9F63_025478, partial [Diploptera punctata]
FRILGLTISAEQCIQNFGAYVIGGACTVDASPEVFLHFIIRLSAWYLLLNTNGIIARILIETTFIYIKNLPVHQCIYRRRQNSSNVFVSFLR